MTSDLHDLSERWFQAWLEKDAGTVERLAAEDYIYIAPSGLVLDRLAILEDHPFSELSAGSWHALRSRRPPPGS